MRFVTWGGVIYSFFLACSSNNIKINGESEFATPDGLEDESEFVIPGGSLNGESEFTTPGMEHFICFR